MNAALFLAVLVVSAPVSWSIVRTWIGDRHAKIETPDSGCSGLIFAERIYPAAVWQGKRTVSRIVLPETGVLVLDANVSFVLDAAQSSCVHVSYDGNNFAHVPANWLPVEENRAVSDLARTPCQWDEVVLPPTEALAIDAAQMEVAVRAISVLGHRLRSQADLRALDTSQLGVAMDISFVLRPQTTCTRETCVCQEDDDEEFCGAAGQHDLIVDETGCEQPIQPDGFCRAICGAYLQVDRWDTIVPRLLRHLAAETGVDYAYEIIDELDDIGQIVVVDKWSGSGGEATMAAMDRLKTMVASSFPEHSLRRVAALSASQHSMPEAVVYYSTSGRPTVRGSFWASAGGVLLTTFALTVLLFAGIYIVFESRLPLLGFRMRPTALRPFLFARFDNTAAATCDDDDDDEDAGRVDLSLHATTALEPAPVERSDCAFDNPLYGNEAESDEKPAAE